MKDTVTRIAGICLDIGIIALVFVSLFWKWPAIKPQQKPSAALPDISDAYWPDGLHIEKSKRSPR